MAKPNDSKGLPEGADPEVIKEMMAAGELPADFAEIPADEPEDEDLEKGDDDGEGDGEDEPEETPAKPKPKPAPKSKDEGEGEDPDGSEGDPDDDEPDPRKEINRKVEHIPAWKAKEMAKKAAEEAATKARKEAEDEFNAKLKGISEKPKEERTADDAEIQALADEFGMDAEKVAKFADRLAGHLASKVKLPDDVLKTLESVKERNARDEEREKAEIESKGFENEWSGEETQKALEEVSRGKEITQQVKEQIKKLAYSSTYHRYRLPDIIALNASTLFPKKSKGVEGGKGGVQSKANVNISDVTPDDIENMSDEEFDRYSETMGKSGSRFIPTKRK